jgi:hypothetical protein
MEIDFSETDFNLNLFSKVLAGIVVLILLGLLGRFVLPQGLLTWDAWQLMKQRGAYQHEVRVLQKAADQLSELVNAEEVEPIQAQLTAEKLAKQFEALTLSSLAEPKIALMDSAQALLDWSLGYDKEPAVTAQRQANQLVLRVSR